MNNTFLFVKRGDVYQLFGEIAGGKIYCADRLWTIYFMGRPLVMRFDLAPISRSIAEFHGTGVYPLMIVFGGHALPPIVPSTPDIVRFRGRVFLSMQNGSSARALICPTTGYDWTPFDLH